MRRISRFPLTIVLVFLTAAVFCQGGPRTQAIRDSLQTVLQTQEGRHRIQTLIAFFNNSYPYFPEKCLAIAAEIEQLSIEHGVRDTVAYATYLKAITFRVQSKFETMRQKALLAHQMAIEYEMDELIGNTFITLGVYHEKTGILDSAILFYEQALTYDGVDPLNVYNNIGLALNRRGQYLRGVQYLDKAMAIAIEDGQKMAASIISNNISNAHSDIGETSKAREYAEKSLVLKEEIGDKRGKLFALNNLAVMDLPLEDQRRYAEEALRLAKEIKDSLFIRLGMANLAGVYLSEGYHEQALALALPAYSMGRKAGKFDWQESMISLAEIYLAKKEYIDALRYAKQFKERVDVSGHQRAIIRANTILLDIYSGMGDYEEYHNLAAIHYPFLDSIQTKSAIDRLAYLDKQLKNIEQEREIETLNRSLEQESINRYRMLALGLVIFLVLSIILYFRVKQIRLQKSVIAKEQQTSQQLEYLNQEIIRAQDQLIVQEKLASLGQLTAGIAHEIKNPLNFVNNFAEDSKELLAELKQKISAQSTTIAATEVAEINELLQDLTLNSNDIHKNGVRVDRIVRNMMEHASVNNSVRVSTSINELVEDNLNLAYHSYKVISKDFDVHISSALADSLPSTKVYPKELGRVLLNLLSNAFYAVKKQQQGAEEDFRPQVKVSTAQSNGEVLIRIWDNGIGIRAEQKDDIFTPFYTTKNTGEGHSGLGLSISYDIVVKQHQGKIEVDSEPGKFTTFTLRLPIQI
ncbi:MAG: ATP-binding protein [Bacteroidota bacterium]